MITQKTFLKVFRKNCKQIKTKNDYETVANRLNTGECPFVYSNQYGTISQALQNRIGKYGKGKDAGYFSDSFATQSDYYDNYDEKYNIDTLTNKMLKILDEEWNRRKRR